MQGSPFINRLRQLCQDNPATIAFPESSDPRIWGATSELLDNRSFANVVLFSRDPLSVYQDAKHAGYDLRRFGDKILWAEQTFSELSQSTSEKALAYHAQRGRPTVSLEAEEVGRNPLAQAGVLLESNKVDVVLAGAQATTSEVIRAAIRFVGLAEGCRTVSGAFILRRGNQDTAKSGDEVLLFADAGVVIEPTQKQLVDIAFASAKTYAQLCGGLDKVALAFLSFSTHGSAQHPAAEKVAAAAATFNKLYPDICADGELQFDASYVSEVALRKCRESSVSGAANCFIFPDLNSGNIAYKIAQRLGNFDAFGPVLQGVRRPYSDLSRGASLGDIVASAYINRLRGLEVD